MNKLTTLAAASALTCAGIGMATASADADQFSSPWIQYREADFTVAAGAGCAFQVDARIVNDKEEYRVLETYADGTDKAQLFKGLLVIEYTNHDTGTSVTRNVNGRGLVEYRPDGSFERITILSGHFSTAVEPDRANIPAGVYYVGGKDTSMTVNPDGTKTFDFGRNGSAENLCPALAG